VRLHGGLRHHQLGGDLGVGQAGGHLEQHLLLARGELAEGGAGRVRGAVRPVRQPGGVDIEEPPGDPRRHHRVAAGHRADGPGQLVQGNVLQHEAAGPGAQGGEGVLVQVERGEDEDPRRAVGGHDPPGGLDAVDARHPDVHQDHVGVQFPGQPDRLGPVAGLAHDVDVVGFLQDHPETGPHQRLVIGQQQADAHRTGPIAAVAVMGRRAWIRHPPAGSGPALTAPS
jgi:hypothetical protein